jgi:CDP-glycerol glycerophosphotransferase (TagB/SpsB family)
MLKKIFRSRRSKAKLFYYIDFFFPKNKHKILFVVKDRTYFSGNLRVVLEAYLSKNNDKLYVYKDGLFSNKLKKELESLNVIVLSSFNLSTVWHILTSATIILSHNPRDAHLSKKCKKRKIINLWHGVAIKQIELLMPNIEKEKLLLLKNNTKLYDMLIASSIQDKITNTNAFGVSIDKVIITGLPRYEILKKNYLLRDVLQKEEDTIKKIKANRKLILFAPTFRENNISAIEQIGIKEWKLLDTFAKKSNIIIGIRPHPYDLKKLPKVIENSSQFYLFENSNFTEVNLLLKHTDILIVDFSSIWIDYLLLHKPIIGFAKDFEEYLNNERGFIYDFKKVFPNFFTSNIDILIEKITISLAVKNDIIYSNAINIFHQHDLEYNYADRIYNEIEIVRSH